jgi:hypothetical protein
MRMPRPSPMLPFQKSRWQNKLNQAHLGPLPLMTAPTGQLTYPCSMATPQRTPPCMDISLNAWNALPKSLVETPIKENYRNLQAPSKRLPFCGGTPSSTSMSTPRLGLTSKGSSSGTTTQKNTAKMNALTYRICGHIHNASFFRNLYFNPCGSIQLTKGFNKHFQPTVM